MIAFLTGRIIHQSLDRVVIDVQGVGYEVFVPLGTQGRLSSQEDERVSVHVYTSVKEDSITLFGFGTMDEKRVFERVTSVSGVGPKLGLAILSQFSPVELITAVEHNDLSAITKVSGVGKKTGQRLILDLKSKFDNFALDAISPTKDAGGQLIDDLRSALQNLGYNGQLIDDVANSMAGKIKDSDTLDDLLREAFKLLR